MFGNDEESAYLGIPHREKQIAEDSGAYWCISVRKIGVDVQILKNKDF